MLQERRFNFLYPPLERLQEHLRQELARNPFLDVTRPKALDDAEDGDDEEPTDSAPPSSDP